MNSADIHSVLTLHRQRSVELYAEADRERLAARLLRNARRWRRSP
ncbi:hypothetical protein WEI85_12595 [Actinomycetes bacterium KLBMP 9797]